MEHVMQHETVSLKEEKQLIRELKQLKQLREELSSNMGSQDEVQQALDQRDQIEERQQVHVAPYTYFVLLSRCGSPFTAYLSWYFEGYNNL